MPEKWTDADYVYVVFALDTQGGDGPDRIDAVKIGYSGFPRGRLRSLQAGAWRPLRLYGVRAFPYSSGGRWEARDRARGFEKTCHEYLAGSRLYGEWFEWSEPVRELLPLFKFSARGY